MPEDKLIGVWQVVSSSLTEKQLLIYFDNPKLQKKIKEFGWAGEIESSQHDYLAVIHTNIAGGKTDRVIKTKINHQVEVLADGSLVDTVSLTKLHKGNPDDVFEGHVNTDYVRFYVPQGSKLLSAKGFDTLPEGRKMQTAAVEPDPDLAKYETNLEVDSGSKTRITDEFGKTVFANWMSVAPGQKKTVTIKYLLPFRYNPQPLAEIAAVEEKNYTWWDLAKQYFFGQKKTAPQKADEQIYSLLIQKQSGTQGIEFTSSLILADNWQVKKYLPENIKAGKEIKYSAVLDTDKYYGVVIESN